MSAHYTESADTREHRSKTKEYILKQEKNWEALTFLSAL